MSFVPEGAGDRPGRLGLTFAPGKQAIAQFMGGPWARDLDVDLRRLIEVYGVNRLVLLLENEIFPRPITR